eukprot:COSAG02_NODE_45728_length_354_cov_1.192157_1_plen_43_part_00
MVIAMIIVVSVMNNDRAEYYRGARIRDGLFWGGWISPALGVC